MHESIKVNIKKLANKIISKNLVLHFDKGVPKIIGCPNMKEYEDIVEMHLAEITPTGHIIMEGALKQLYEDLEKKILQQLVKSIESYYLPNFLANHETEEYWTELDY